MVTAQGPEAVWDEVSVDSTVCRAHVHAVRYRANIHIVSIDHWLKRLT